MVLSRRIRCIVRYDRERGPDNLIFYFCLHWLELRSSRSLIIYSWPHLLVKNSSIDESHDESRRIIRRIHRPIFFSSALARRRPRIHHGERWLYSIFRDVIACIISKMIVVNLFLSTYPSAFFPRSLLRHRFASRSNSVDSPFSSILRLRQCKKHFRMHRPGRLSSARILSALLQQKQWRLWRLWSE